MTDPVAPLVLTAGDIAHAMRGRLLSGDPLRRLDRVSIDSRSLQPGDLFVAIRGERFDGHSFVAQALQAGAAGVVVAQIEWIGTAADISGAQAGTPGTAVVIQVDETTRALQSLAREVRRQSGARVVAITGSAGKTTTKEVTAEFLGIKYRTFRNKGNFNNHIGLPLSLLELRARPQMAVVELGMSAPGEIRTLVDIAEPDVRVWTNVAEAHLEAFPSVEAIADAKAEILERATANTRLIVNGADTRIARRLRDFPGKITRFGIDIADADVRAVDVKDLGLEGIRATVSTPVGAAVLSTPLVGRANLANVLAAMAVALDAKIPLADIVGRARTLQPAPHRGQVLRLPSGVTVLDDTYNANPLAMRRALEVLASDRQATRRIAVLGEMLELGGDSVRLHEVCGRAAADAGVDLLITVGGDPAEAMGIAAQQTQTARRTRLIVRHTPTSELAADLVDSLVEPGDVVLIKGSRGIRLERVVERLQGAEDGASH